jgi:hypothetical protein
MTAMHVENRLEPQNKRDVCKLTTDPKDLKKPFEILVVSKAYVYGNPREPEHETELINVHITALDPLDCVAIAGKVIAAMRELKKEPEVKILP